MFVVVNPGIPCLRLLQLARLDDIPSPPMVAPLKPPIVRELRPNLRFSSLHMQRRMQAERGWLV